MVGHFNQPVVIKGKSILQGQFAGVRMSLGIEHEEQSGVKEKRRVKDKREGDMEVEGEKEKGESKKKKKKNTNQSVEFHYVAA